MSAVKQLAKRWQTSFCRGSFFTDWIRISSAVKDTTALPVCPGKKGVKSRILEKFPKALYTHYGALILNLAIGDACKLPAITNMFAVVNEGSCFFASSAKRTQCLDEELSQELAGMRTKVLCVTRWSSRVESVENFLEMLEPISTTLESLSTTSDAETSSKARSLLRK